MSLQDRIREARKSLGLTQGQLATRCGIAVSTICSYEKGEREPNAHMINLLSRALGVTGDYLLELPDYKSEDNKLLDLYHQLNSDGRDYIMKQLIFALSQDEYKKASSSVSEVG